MPARSSPSEPLGAYLGEIQRNLRSGIAREHTHRHALEDLLEALDPSIEAFNDPKHIEVGAPDFTIRRKGHATDFPVGWVETKDVGDDLDKVEKSEQLKSYLGLPSLVLTDYLEFRKGRRLSSHDIDHYQKILVALSETIRIMREIDEIIPGWPLP